MANQTNDGNGSNSNAGQNGGTGQRNSSGPTVTSENVTRAAAPSEMRRTSAGGKVTVACKHPNGLILRLFKAEAYDVPVLGGGSREEKRQAPITGAQVVLNGYANNMPAAPNGFNPDAATAGGYGLTFDVDEDFMSEWLRQNRDSDLVKNRIVFVSASTERARHQGREQEKVWDGMSPVNPESDPRTKRIGKVGTDLDYMKNNPAFAKKQA